MLCAVEPTDFFLINLDDFLAVTAAKAYGVGSRAGGEVTSFFFSSFFLGVLTEISISPRLSVNKDLSVFCMNFCYGSSFSVSSTMPNSLMSIR